MNIQLTKLTLSTAVSGFLVLATESSRQRTEVWGAAEEPQLRHTLFGFGEVDALRVVLMCGERVEGACARASGVVRIGEERIREGVSKRIELKYKEHVIGVVVVRITSSAPSMQQGMLYRAEEKDPLVIQRQVEALEQQMKILFERWKGLQGEEDALERVLGVLHKDQQQIKALVQAREQESSTIIKMLEGQEDEDLLTIQVDLLKGSREGRDVLRIKLGEMRGRIDIEEQLKGKREKEYERVRSAVEEMAESRRELIERKKGKKVQQFQIEKNMQLLERKEVLEEQFVNNEAAIAHLVKLSKESQFTAEQAGFLLSQVNYQLKMQEEKSDQTENDLGLQDNNPPLQQEVLQFKLEALLNQIQRVKSRIQDPF